MTTETGRLPIAQPRCSTCTLGQFCLPVGIPAPELERLDELVSERRRLKKGEVLYRANDELSAVYGIRFGSLKSCVTAPDGREQVVGFHLQGELIGLDAVADSRHPSSAIALEDSELCIARFNELETLSRQVPSLQRQMHRLMSQEIRNEHQQLLALGTMRAEERLAVFLLNLSDRLLARGYAANEFVLRMSREEIGSFLGLKLETVSRLFSRFAQSGMLEIRQRHVKIIDGIALRTLAGAPC